MRELRTEENKSCRTLKELVYFQNVICHHLGSLARLYNISHQLRCTMKTSKACSWQSSLTGAKFSQINP